MKSLRQLRKEKGLTQAQLAKKLYVTSQAVANYECYKRAPSLVLAQRYAECLDVSLDELAKIISQAIS